MDPSKLLDDEPGLASAEAMTAVDEMNAPTHDRIAELAYEYWEARGGHGGSPWDDWFRAEDELKRRGDD
jgi:hypothetical protein